MKNLKLGKYKHFKGNYYEVLGVAFHSELREKMVVYKALYINYELQKEYGDYPLFVRPFKIFIEKVEINGKKVPRFKYIGPI